MDVNQLGPLGQTAKRTARPEWTIRRLLKLRQLEGAKVVRDWFLTIDEVSRQEKEFKIKSAAKA